jgi:hypothetical protein
MDWTTQQIIALPAGWNNKLSSGEKYPCPCMLLQRRGEDTRVVFGMSGNLGDEYRVLPAADIAEYTETVYG